jgi:hypothetical protein
MTVEEYLTTPTAPELAEKPANTPAWQPVGLSSWSSVVGKYFGVRRNGPYPTGCQTKRPAGDWYHTNVP